MIATIIILMNLTLNQPVKEFTGPDARSDCAAAMQAKAMDRTNRFSFACVEKK